MSVPETAVHENNGASGREYKVGPAGKVPAMQAETETERVQTAAQRQFGFRVTAADAAHVEAALFRREHVHHDRPHIAIASATILSSAAAISPRAIPGRSVTAPKRKVCRYSGWNRRPGISVSARQSRLIDKVRLPCTLIKSMRHQPPLGSRNRWAFRPDAFGASPSCRQTAGS